MSSIQSVMHESRVFEPRAEWVAQANVKKADYDAMCAKAASNFEGFWADLARDTLAWHKPFTKALDESSAPFYKWFEDGQMNVSYNCLDRNLEQGKGDRVAIVFGGFSAKSLQERIVDVGAVAVITADEQMRGGKPLPLKSIIDDALGMGGCEAVRNVI